MTLLNRACKTGRQLFVLGLLASVVLMPVDFAFAKGGRGGGGDDRSDDFGRGRGRGSDDGPGHSRGRGSDDGIGHSRGSSHGSVFGHRHRVGTIVRELPGGHREIFVIKRPFFFHEGRFYNRHSNGYILVRAPIGAVIATLPLGFVSFVIGGHNYYLAGDTYYSRGPDGYVVVNSPVQEKTGNATVNTDQLNVRSGPAASYSIFRVINYGEQLYVIGAVPGWLNVELEDGSVGWVMERFVIFQPDQPQG